MRSKGRKGAKGKNKAKIAKRVRDGYAGIGNVIITDIGKLWTCNSGHYCLRSRHFTHQTKPIF